MPQPTGTESRVCELIAALQRIGVAKYGTTVARNPLELRAWLQHALEECLDQAVYLQRAIEEVDAKLELARDVRRQWMRMMGMADDAIDESFRTSPVKDIELERDQLVAMKQITKGGET